MDVIADLFTKYNCINCQDDINGIRVHCAECESFDLCLPCFAAGAEIGQHKNDHDYQFMDTGTTILSVFRGKGAWTAREEIRLLDAIEQYGFGNWEDVSKHIETKSAEDAKEEYVSKFVNGTIGRHTWMPAQTQRPTLVDHTTEDTGPLGATALSRLPPLDITTEEALQLGYMPNRDSFEREYDPTAEQLISNLSMNVDDTEADYLLKLAHVDMYTRRLRERVRRKRIVRDYQLVANFFRNRNYAQHPGMTREQKDFRDRFRVFAQFYTSEEYERLLSSLEREKELRIRLSELCRYRYNGLTKIDECRHFEQHAAISGRNTGPYGHGKTDNTPHNIGSHRLHGYSLPSPTYSHKEAESSKGSEANSSLIALKSTHHIGDPTSYGASLPSKSYLDSYRGSSAHTTTAAATGMMNSMPPPNAIVLPTGAATMMAGSTHGPHLQSQHAMKLENKQLHKQQQHQQQHLQIQANHPQSATAALQQLLAAKSQQKLRLNLSESLGKSASASPNKQGLQNPLNPSMSSSAPALPVSPRPRPPRSAILQAQLDELRHLPQPLGMNLLSSNEQQLCKIFNLTPTTYLSLKTVLLNDKPLNMQLSPVENSLRKYFVKVGWLSH